MRSLSVIVFFLILFSLLVYGKASIFVYPFWLLWAQLHATSKFFFHIILYICDKIILEIIFFWCGFSITARLNGLVSARMYFNVVCKVYSSSKSIDVHLTVFNIRSAIQVSYVFFCMQRHRFTVYQTTREKCNRRKQTHICMWCTKSLSLESWQRRWWIFWILVECVLVCVFVNFLPSFFFESSSIYVHLFYFLWIRFSFLLFCAHIVATERY